MSLAFAILATTASDVGAEKPRSSVTLKTIDTSLTVPVASIQSVERNKGVVIVRLENRSILVTPDTDAPEMLGLNIEEAASAFYYALTNIVEQLPPPPWDEISYGIDQWRKGPDGTEDVNKFVYMKMTAMTVMQSLWFMGNFPCADIADSANGPTTP